MSYIVNNDKYMITKDKHHVKLMVDIGLLYPWYTLALPLIYHLGIATLYQYYSKGKVILMDIYSLLYGIILLQKVSLCLHPNYTDGG